MANVFGIVFDSVTQSRLDSAVRLSFSRRFRGSRVRQTTGHCMRNQLELGLHRTCAIMNEGSSVPSARLALAHLGIVSSPNRQRIPVEDEPSRAAEDLSCAPANYGHAVVAVRKGLSVSAIVGAHITYALPHGVGCPEDLEMEGRPFEQIGDALECVEVSGETSLRRSGVQTVAEPWRLSGELSRPVQPPPKLECAAWVFVREVGLCS